VPAAWQVGSREQAFVRYPAGVRLAWGATGAVTGRS